MVRRLIKAGHQCVVYDVHPPAVAELVKEGAVGAASLDELVQKLKPPRPVSKTGKRLGSINSAGLALVPEV